MLFKLEAIICKSWWHSTWPKQHRRSAIRHSGDQAPFCSSKQKYCRGLQYSMFCLELDPDNHPKLKRKHDYYYQVHCQTYWADKVWCDFVVQTTTYFHLKEYVEIKYGRAFSLLNWGNVIIVQYIQNLQFLVIGKVESKNQIFFCSHIYILYFLLFFYMLRHVRSLLSCHVIIILFTGW